MEKGNFSFKIHDDDIYQDQSTKSQQHDHWTSCQWVLAGPFDNQPQSWIRQRPKTKQKKRNWKNTLIKLIRLDQFIEGEILEVCHFATLECRIWTKVMKKLFDKFLNKKKCLNMWVESSIGSGNRAW